ncbi:MAG: divalent-cation tolerance protein CutA [Acidobacteriota bacterium]
MTDVRVVFSTVGSEADAARIAEALVNEHLVACVNVISGVRSIYRWKGVIQRDDELLLVIKTARDRLEAAMTRLKELHPYEVPEMVVLPVEGGHGPYLDWVRDETR